MNYQWRLTHMNTTAKEAAAGLPAQTRPGSAPRKASPARLWITQLFKFLGPAFVVSVAYIDPGNFATNIGSGSAFQYSLLWVILASNLMAIFLQVNSAKLGIATGKNLSEMCGAVFGKTANRALWVISGLAAIATTMAEFLGGALGFYLLFGIPLPLAGVLTAAVTFLIVYMQKYGQKTVEAIIAALGGGDLCGHMRWEMVLSSPDWGAVALHTVLPSLPDGHAVYLAAGDAGRDCDAPRDLPGTRSSSSTGTAASP